MEPIGHDPRDDENHDPENASKHQSEAGQEGKDQIRTHGHVDDEQMRLVLGQNELKEPNHEQGVQGQRYEAHHDGIIP